MKAWGFLSLTKTKEVLEPYIKINPFASAKFDQKKYEEDKNSVISYYNSLGYRDATIVKDTPITAKDGMHLYLQAADQRGLARVVSIQNPYNLLNRTFEIGLAEIAIRENVCDRKCG